jgi:hypothetical protein
VRHRHDHKRQQKKIERVQRPPEKTGDKRVPLIAVEEFKKPDRFHSVFQLFAWLSYRKLESQEAAIVRESDSSVAVSSAARLPNEAYVVGNKHEGYKLHAAADRAFPQ